MSGAESVRLATILKKRLVQENPLLHPEIFPVNFTAARTSNSGWIELSFGDLEMNDVLHFPKLEKQSINPIALELTSGPHALKKGNAILTYMRQLSI